MYRKSRRGYQVRLLHLLTRNGRWKNQMRKAAHNGCCRRVAQTRALCLVLWKLLISEGLLKPLTAVEIPLVDILSDMELWGIGVDMEGCLRAREIAIYGETQRYTLHGHWLQTSTGTGRLSMEEPNLQCVEHMIDFKMNNNDKADGESDADHYKINARDFFVPTQIELRLMAHFSKDSSLIELLSNPHGDVFTMIAARWTGKSESIMKLFEKFKASKALFPVLLPGYKKQFLSVVRKGFYGLLLILWSSYVETLNGRKRFLSKIKFGNSKEKSKAQRQAVNSICQVHDELVLEADHSVVKEAGMLLRTSMENAASNSCHRHLASATAISTISFTFGDVNALIDVELSSLIDVESIPVGNIRGATEENSLIGVHASSSNAMDASSSIPVGTIWGATEENSPIGVHASSSNAMDASSSIPAGFVVTMNAFSIADTATRKPSSLKIGSSSNNVEVSAGWEVDATVSISDILLKVFLIMSFPMFLLPTSVIAFPNLTIAAANIFISVDIFSTSLIAALSPTSTCTSTPSLSFSFP
nr:helicase and polymerase-containing protein TEBICHI isoform X1 [Ipomoea batatas]